MDDGEEIAELIIDLSIIEAYFSSVDEIIKKMEYLRNYVMWKNKKAITLKMNIKRLEEKASDPNLATSLVNCFVTAQDRITEEIDKGEKKNLIFLAGNLLPSKGTKVLVTNQYGEDKEFEEKTSKLVNVISLEQFSTWLEGNADFMEFWKNNYAKEN